MDWVLNLGVLITTFCFMEFAAWSVHKYIMHGFLWNLHKDHHKKEHNSFFEMNDYFFIIFALPGILLIYFGYESGLNDFRFWMGIGITLYGFTYVFVHDIFIHQRVKIFRNVKSIYFRGMKRAHKIHHKHLGKEDGECFGFLWVPQKYLHNEKNIKV